MYLCADRAFHLYRLVMLPAWASGWLRFGITALPKHGPPLLSHR